MSADPLGGFRERAENNDGEKRTQLIGAEHNHPSESFIDRSENIRWTDHRREVQMINGVAARPIETCDKLGGAAQ
jgi:hypothetical protein